MSGRKKKKQQNLPGRSAPGSNVVSIVGEVQRRIATEAQIRASATHRREAEAAADMAATQAELEDLDLDRAIALCDDMPPEEARISRTNFRSLRAMRRCLRGDVAGGLADWEAIIAEQPNIPGTYMMRANWLKTTDPRAALADVERAVALEPASPVWYARRGDFHVMVNELDRAIADYRRSAAMDPKQADVQYQLGKCLAARGDLPEALAAYDRAVQLAPLYVDFRIGRGEVLLSLGHHERALVEFNRSLAMAPKDADAHVGRAKAVAAQGYVEDAIKAVSRAIEIAPGHGWARMLRALYRNGQAGEAARAQVKADLAKAVESEPANVAFLLKRGELLMGFGDIEDGLADTERAITGLDAMLASQPATDTTAHVFPQLYYNRAFCKARLAEARRARDPAHEETEAARRERCTSAIADLERAIEMGMCTEDLYVELVRLHAQRGDAAADQRAALDRALRAVPESDTLLAMRKPHLSSP
jgi:tetratricopeptide (TPR) repeat protein